MDDIVFCDICDPPSVFFIPRDTDVAGGIAPRFAFVESLNGTARPAAVFRGIIPINVDTVNAELVRITMSQSPFFERAEALRPLRADDYTTGAILPVRGRGRPETARLNTNPNSV